MENIFRKLKKHGFVSYVRRDFSKKKETLLIEYSEIFGYYNVTTNHGQAYDVIEDEDAKNISEQEFNSFLEKAKSEVFYPKE